MRVKSGILVKKYYLELPKIRFGLGRQKLESMEVYVNIENFRQKSRERE